jgi:predicted nucleic acid-binding protein
MVVVVSDTNVFVALFKCGLINKVFSDARVRVVIPTRIYEELTAANHRVSREFPELSTLIKDLLFNDNHGHPVDLSKFDYEVELTEPMALAAHYFLVEQATLDRGEMEAIPVAIQLSAVFVTCEVDAIAEYRGISAQNGSSAFLFEHYCEELERQQVINRGELELIMSAIRE